MKIDECFAFSKMHYIVRKASSTADKDCVTTNFHQLSSSFDPAFMLLNCPFCNLQLLGCKLNHVSPGAYFCCNDTVINFFACIVF